MGGTTLDILTHKDSNGLTKALAGEVSSCLRRSGCRCVWISRLETNQGLSFSNIQCVNTFEPFCL